MSGRDPETGQFVHGNRFWLQRSSAGPKPRFDNPDKLWQCCLEYFEYSTSIPLKEEKLFSYEGDIVRGEVDKVRPFTLGGLCIFLDISLETWQEWRKTRSDLSGVISSTETIIRKQKFDGATAGLMNANIIARDLGLADKSELQNLDKNGAPADPVGPNVYLSAALEAVKKADENAQ